MIAGLGEILRPNDLEKKPFRESSALHLLRRRPALNKQLLRRDIAKFPQDPLNVVANLGGKLAVVAIQIWHGEHHSENSELSISFLVGHWRTIPPPTIATHKNFSSERLQCEQ